MSACLSGSGDDQIIISYNRTLTTGDASCSPRWIVYPGMGGDPDWQNTTATTQQQCLEACIANSRCLAIEWSDRQKCWVHFTHPERRTKSDVTLFEIVMRCDSEFST